jgi:outer membrane protein assembly factor BamE
MRVFRLSLLSLALGLAGCGVIYKVDVNQGNLMDQEAIDQLKPGMTKRQVTLLLGSPSVQSPFDQDRWDYASTFSRRGGPTAVKNLTLYFEDNLLVRLEGDYFEEKNLELLEDANRVRGTPFDPEEELTERERRRAEREARGGG